jgi:hypothetical protein
MICDFAPPHDHQALQGPSDQELPSSHFYLKALQQGAR